ncbi:MAG: HdeD family acid-resistance protein [Anaerovoracaceae bacterium]
MDFKKSVKLLGIFGGIALILIGLAFAFAPAQVEVLLVWIFGAGMMVAGISRVFVGAMMGKGSQGRVWVIIAGIAMAILAIGIVVYPQFSIFFAGVSMGIAAFFTAFDRFALAFQAHKVGEKYGALIAMGIINVFFGAFMLSACFVMITAMIMIIGIYLIVLGIMIIISGIFFKPEKIQSAIYKRMDNSQQ